MGSRLADHRERVAHCLQLLQSTSIKKAPELFRRFETCYFEIEERLLASGLMFGQPKDICFILAFKSDFIHHL